MSTDAVERLVARLRETPRYGGLCDHALFAAAAAALDGHRSEKAALKSAKRRLHQMFGSFLEGRRRRLLDQLGQAAAAADDDPAWLAALRQALALHASTDERRAHLEELWQAIRGHVPQISSVVDLGCGVNPAALPWSGLSRDVRYLGLDLDLELCAALEEALADRFPHLQVRPADLRGKLELPSADVALLWKLLPTLERQAAGAGRALAAQLRVGWCVATFPTRSLSGRGFGAAAQYRALAKAVLGPGITFEVGDELVYLTRGRRHEEAAAT